VATKEKHKENKTVNRERVKGLVKQIRLYLSKRKARERGKKRRWGNRRHKRDKEGQREQTRTKNSLDKGKAGNKLGFEVETAVRTNEANSPNATKGKDKAKEEYRERFQKYKAH